MLQAHKDDARWYAQQIEQISAYVNNAQINTYNRVMGLVWLIRLYHSHHDTDNLNLVLKRFTMLTSDEHARPEFAGLSGYIAKLFGNAEVQEKVEQKFKSVQLETAQVGVAYLEGMMYFPVDDIARKMPLNVYYYDIPGIPAKYYNVSDFAKVEPTLWQVVQSLPEVPKVILDRFAKSTRYSAAVEASRAITHPMLGSSPVPQR